MQSLNEKIEIIKKLKSDEADLIIRFYEYYTEKYSLNDSTKVYKKSNGILENLHKQFEETYFVVFSTLTINESKNVYYVPIPNIDEKFIEENYYAGKNLEQRLSQKYLNTEVKEILLNNKNVVFVINTSEVSTFPIWNTKMRRKANAIFENIEKEENINNKTIKRIVNEENFSKISHEKGYDLDFLIQFFKEAKKITNFKTIYISEENQEEIFFINEFEKFLQALNINENKFDYIYDTLCKDLDVMFLKYGFCSFKNNKCISQRHKGIFNAYPTPRTDGCCFKVIRKCQYNNKDGTCKVKCLACKLFSCPYLTQKGITINSSELLLMRAFLNNKQKRDAIYSFYEPKESIINKFKAHE